MTTFPLQGYFGPANAVEQSDGKLVIDINSESTVVRLLPNGQQDTTFGDSGQVVPAG